MTYCVGTLFSNLLDLFGSITRLSEIDEGY